MAITRRPFGSVRGAKGGKRSSRIGCDAGGVGGTANADGGTIRKTPAIAPLMKVACASQRARPRRDIATLLARHLAGPLLRQAAAKAPGEQPGWMETASPPAA